MHSKGVNALRADGSVAFVSENIDRTIWQQIGDRERTDPISNTTF
jgi:prepilin-type processing-associated H-X9-DG protein